MSKALTRENDDADDEPDTKATAAPPSTVRNLITPAGLERLRTEIKELRTVERPKVVETVAWAAGNGDRSENGDYIYGKRRLRQIDSRIHFLGERLKVAEPVDPALQKNRDQVFFGATVTYVVLEARGAQSAPRGATEDGPERMVRIVGVDEVNNDERVAPEARVPQEISWVSPVAKALMRARVGDVVRIATPAGAKAIEVVEIAYPKA